MRHELNEVLNELIDYFLLADIRALLAFKERHQLDDNGHDEFTTDDSGDRAMADGAVLPLAGIENLPYTVLFTFDEPSLLAAHARVERRRDTWMDFT